MVIDDFGQFGAHTDKHGAWRCPSADAAFACRTFVIVERVDLTINDFAVMKQSIGFPVAAISGKNKLIFVLAQYRTVLG